MLTVLTFLMGVLEVFGLFLTVFTVLGLGVLDVWSLEVLTVLRWGVMHV